MFSYFPYTSYNYGHPYQYQAPYPLSRPDSADSSYFRALADEQAAREQYLATRRAQEDARERAARARTVRHVHSPYNSFLYHDGEDDFDHGFYGYGYPMSTRHQRAMYEEQRRREMVERERARLEEERREEARRQRALEEERRQRAMEEERLRRILEEDERRGEEEEWPRESDVDSLDPFLRALGLQPPSVSRGYSTSPRLGRTPMRAHTASPPQHRRPMPHPQETYEPSTAYPQQHPSHTTQSARSASVPPRTSAQRTTSPSPKPERQAEYRPSLTPEQNAAARKILAAYRTHASRGHVLRAIASLHTRFASLQARFVAPPTIDFLLPSGTHVTVPVESVIPSPSLDAKEVLEENGRPRLAYTSANSVIHAYQEELNRILAALDAVESGGNIGVRESRRDLARSVEQEAECIERWIGEVWDEWVHKEGWTVVGRLPEGQEGKAHEYEQEHATATEPMKVEEQVPEKRPEAVVPTSIAPVIYPPVEPQASQVSGINIQVVEPTPAHASPEPQQLYDDDDAGDDQQRRVMIEIVEDGEPDLEGRMQVVSAEVEASAGMETPQSSEPQAVPAIEPVQQTAETSVLLSVEGESASQVPLPPLDINVADIPSSSPSMSHEVESQGIPTAARADVTTETGTAPAESAPVDTDSPYSPSDSEHHDIPPLEAGVETEPETELSPQTPSLDAAASPTIVPVELPAVAEVPAQEKVLGGVELQRPATHVSEGEMSDMF